MLLATKERLLAGGAPSPFAVPEMGGEEVMLRPLSAGEAAHVQRLQVAGITLGRDGMDALGELGGRKVGQARKREEPKEDPKPAKAAGFDLGAIVDGAFEANVWAVAYGMTDPVLTADEVRSIRIPGFVERVGEEVQKRSGLGEDASAALARFRDLAGGAGATPTPPGGDAASADGGSPDPRAIPLPVDGTRDDDEGEGGPQ